MLTGFRGAQRNENPVKRFLAHTWLGFITILTATTSFGSWQIQDIRLF